MGMTTARTKAIADGDGGTAGPTSISDIEACTAIWRKLSVNVMQSSEKVVSWVLMSPSLLLARTTQQWKAASLADSRDNA